MAKSKNGRAVAPVIDPQYCCYRLRAAESKIHRWGVYADQNIPANRKVIEYRGEKIDRVRQSGAERPPTCSSLTITGRSTAE